MTTNVHPGSESAGQTEPNRWVRRYVWQRPIRVFHWVYALATVVLFGTGLWIAWPAFSASGEAYDTFVFARVRTIHFAAGYIFLVAFLWRAVYFFIGNKYARSGFPYVWRRDWWRALFQQAHEYATLDIKEAKPGHNALAGLAYVIFPIGLGILLILTGFALYGQDHEGGFWEHWTGWVIPLFGGSFPTHMWHRLFAWGFAFFVIIHVYIVMVDSWAYRNGIIESMISGEKFERDDGKDES